MPRNLQATSSRWRYFSIDHQPSRAVRGPHEGFVLFCFFLLASVDGKGAAALADRPDLMPSIYGGPAETDGGVRGAGEALYMKGGSRTCERVHLELKIDYYFF